MTVEQLIEALKKYPADMSVLIPFPAGGSGRSRDYSEINGIVKIGVIGSNLRLDGTWMGNSDDSDEPDWQRVCILYR